MTAEQRGSSCYRVIDRSFYAFGRLRRNHRADIGVVVQWIAGLKFFGPSDEDIAKPLIDSRLHQNALGADAVLPGCPKRAGEAALDRFIEVTVVQNDYWGIAAPIPSPAFSAPPHD